MSNTQSKFNLIFVMYGGGHVIFNCPNMEVVKIHLKKFQEAVDIPKKEGERAVLFADDEFGNHVSMVVCSHVLGYYLTEDRSGEFFANQKKISDAMEKHLGGGEEWKG